MDKFRPSEAPRWYLCPGSVRMQQGQPDGDNEAAAEGTAAHWVAARMIHYQRSGIPVPEFVDCTAPNGVPITYDMVASARVFADSIVSSAPGDTPLYSEFPVNIPQVHPDLSGTLDAAFVSGDNLIIWDFKHGWGIVEPYENPQLLLYALGMINQLRDDGRQMPKYIYLCIVQPRPYHSAGPVRSWGLTLNELAEYADKLKAQADKAFTEIPETVPGSQCRDCLARFGCRALQYATYYAHDAISQAHPDDLAPSALGRELRFLNQLSDLLKARIDGLHPRALEIIKQGNPIPGWTAKPGRYSRQWSKPEQEIKMLGQLAGVDMIDNILKSPAKAEAAGMPKELVNSCTKKVGGTLRLVKVDPSEADRIFDKRVNIE